ncbi:MAG TPA: translation initiation factor IF-2 [Polyangiaceae bacterium LLY-WYZ-15_(1-7)]|nr:translation initiation factor IF-2 [Polyangiaceae bacterium LLY-WYZ-15_(1-7)]HJL09569.1 translation initiation factor IF-2 [Polyangiaceae bacterium LLY-WYZ-15_(1-7)]
MSVLDPAEVDRVKRALEKDRAEAKVEEQIRPTVTRRRRRKKKPVAEEPAASAPEESSESPAEAAAKAAIESRAAAERAAARKRAAEEKAAAEQAEAERKAAEAEAAEEKAAAGESASEEKAAETAAAETAAKAEAAEATAAEEKAAAEKAAEEKAEAEKAEAEAKAAEEKAAEEKAAAEKAEAEAIAAEEKAAAEKAAEEKAAAEKAEAEKKAAEALPDAASRARRAEPPPAEERLTGLPPGVKKRGNTIAPPPGVGGRRKELTPEERRRIVEQHQASRPRRQIRSRSSIGPQARPHGRGKRRSQRGIKPKQTEITVPSAHKRKIQIEDQVALQTLAQGMSIKATDLLMKLMQMGVQGVHINSTLDADTAAIIAEEFNYEVENVARSAEEVVEDARGDFENLDEDQEGRPPVVTIMGHVDHGKTSLLDKIRSAKVAEGEAGGITQHISSFRVDTDKGTVVFLDTPGHEAFTAMRARGANSTDIVILVVAADDGAMPQTKEAISHSQAAGVPIIVAVNKIDKPDANAESVMNELASLGLTPEDWGGDTMYVSTSAITGQGIDELLDSILLQAEVMELTANSKIPAEGVVLEARLDRGRGVVANVLIQDGSVATGDYVVAGSSWGRVRALTDDRGKQVKQAGPATPVELLGLDSLPDAGDKLYKVTNAKRAQEVAEANQKDTSTPTVSAPRGLEHFQQMMQSGEQEELQLVVKADVHGSIEALNKSLEDLSTDKVRVKIVHSGVGGITENDVMLASASEGLCIIIGFNVRPQGKANSMAKKNGVEIRTYSVIYEAIDEVKAAMAGLLAPKLVEKDLGQAEVRATFGIPKVGTIAGCMVTEGKVVRSAKARLVRDGVVVWDGKISSLKRVKDDVREVANGFECGIGLENFNDIKEGDVIECYEVEEVAATLEDA